MPNFDWLTTHVYSNNYRARNFDEFIDSSLHKSIDPDNDKCHVVLFIFESLRLNESLCIWVMITERISLK